MSKIAKRADGRYQISVYLGRDADGKKHSRVVYGATQKEVKEKAEELRTKLGKGIDLRAGKDSFEAWTKRWLLARKIEDSPAQYALYEARSKYIVERIGTRKMSEITTAELQEIINEFAEHNPRTGKPTAKKTLKDYKAIMLQIFKTAIQARAVDYDPAEFVRIPQDAAKTERRALSEVERGWIERIPHRAQTAAMIMLYAGLRRGEVSALTWNDIDLDAGTITVNKSVTYKGDEPQSIKDPKTDAGIRVVPIPKKLINYLSELPRNTLLVVTSARGKQMTETAWTRLWESYLSVINEQCGLQREGASRFDPKGLPMLIEPFTPHCLRHTYCTLLYEAGVDALVAKELMGHRDVKTTLGIYTHLSHTHKTKNAALLDRYLGDVPDGQNKAV